MKIVHTFVAVHPHLTLILFVIFSMALVVIAYSWEEFLQGSELIRYIGQSIIQIAAALFFIFILWRLGWLGACGFSSIGRSQTWLMVLPVLIYFLLINVYICSGNFSFDLSNTSLIFWLSLSSLTVGLFEETVFRGIVLLTFLLLWGRSKYGVTKSISMTALLFGCIYGLRLEGNSVFQTVLNILTAAFAGFFFGVILLHGRSIWIPIVFRGLSGAAINLSMHGKNVVETSLISFIKLLAIFPVFLVGLALLKKIPQKWEEFPQETPKRRASNTVSVDGEAIDPEQKERQ